MKLMPMQVTEAGLVSVDPTTEITNCRAVVSLRDDESKESDNDIDFDEQDDQLTFEEQDIQ